jgi:hypothetical protein
LQAEQKLREYVYAHALPEKDVALGPAQVLFERLQQPFEDQLIPAFRLAAALCCRSWFAADVCQHRGLLDLLLDPKKVSSAMCKWRFGVVLVLANMTASSDEHLRWGVQASPAFGGTLAKYKAQLAQAVQAGMYGTGGWARERVAAVPAVADVTG